MQDYRKLDVWLKSHELALDVHRVTAMRSREGEGPMGDERQARAEVAADIRAEVRRAALCVPIRIVVGCEAETAPEFAQAMRDAAALVDEFAYRLRFARDAGMLEPVPYAKLEARANQLRAMLGALNRTVRLKLGAAGRPAGTRAPDRPTPAARAMLGGRDDGSSRPRSRPRSTS